MGTADEIVTTLHRIGATISADGIQAPRKALTPDVRYAVRQHELLLRMLYRLRMRQRWLSEQYERYFDRPGEAATHELFSRRMAEWDLLERQLRNHFGYQDCIHGPGSAVQTNETTSDKAPVRCIACGEEQIHMAWANA